MLIALSLLLQPMMSLRQTACDCCEPGVQESGAESMGNPVSVCCVDKAGPRSVGGSEPVPDREDDDGGHTCPASCCLGLATVGLLSAGWMAPLTPEPGAWDQPTSDRYVSTPASGLTKPPRPVRLV
jgi:hypothetical protein